MKLRFWQPLIFLILLILTFLSQTNVAFSVIPGWHTVIYPPAYLAEMGIIVLSLIGAIGGYFFLAIKKHPLHSGSFFLHVLLTIPIIIAFLYNSITADFGSLSGDELNKQYSLAEWIGYLLIAVFIAGQLFFWWAFLRNIHPKIKAV